MIYLFYVIFPLECQRSEHNVIPVEKLQIFKEQNNLSNEIM
jgi:hypothetical protein